MIRFKYQDGVVPNVIAGSYVIAGQASGIALLAAPSALGNAVGVLLIAHSLMIATYLVHEAIHETVFTTHRENTWLGRLAVSLVGGAWAGYDRLRKKHLHHHADMMDPTTVDLRGYLAGAPQWLRKTVDVLEWGYVPAVELLLRVEHATRPFRHPADRSERRRVAVALVLSATCWLALWWLSAKAVVLYGCAYLLFMTGLRVFDAFHHSFDLVLIDDYDTPYRRPAGRDRAYEQANTFSNVLIAGHPRANLAVLNFVFHNAHHAKPGVPWHRLPALDRQLYGEHPRHERGIASHFGAFHRYRLARIHCDPRSIPPGDGAPVNLGAVAVSLLTI